MNKYRVNQLLLLLILLFGFTSNLLADGKPNITTEELRVILPPSVARSTSAYGIIKNIGNAPDTLINISTNAGMIMLHKTEITDGMAQMNHVENLVLKAGEELVLKPMSYHLMFMEINHDVIKKEGMVSITLEFKEAGELTFNVPVLEE